MDLIRQKSLSQVREAGRLFGIEDVQFASLTNDDLKVQVDHEGMERVMEVYEPCVQKHLYESSGDEEDRKAHVPPFNSWKCLEGTGPVPIVACIYQQIPNSANGN